MSKKANSTALTARKLIADVLSASGVPTATLDHLVDRYQQKRIDEARQVLLDEIAADNLNTDSAVDEDDLLAILWRYSRAVHEGAARRNLRLLARAIVGLVNRHRLYADEFYKYADTLARKPAVSRCTP